MSSRPPDRPASSAERTDTLAEQEHGPAGGELVGDLAERIAELDAIAWNLPSRRQEPSAEAESAT
jgi:hypothetical protein